MRPDSKLPSTASLRVFAAVARSGSTVRAAEEVGLTQSAVSKQVRLLEEALGCTLFDRSPTGLVLTEDGSIYRPYAESALEQMARGRRRLGERGAARRPVRLHMLAIVGERWLMARFPDFTAAHPDIDVQFTHYVSENETEEPDIDIRHGEGNCLIMKRIISLAKRWLSSARRPFLTGMRATSGRPTSRS